jgi:RNA polymerase sigma factor (sigma-70 family)
MEEVQVDESHWEEKLIELERAWDCLEPNDRLLLEKYYYQEIPLNKIAESENKSDASIRKQKQRSLDKLRDIFFNLHQS